jgi:PAS domain S-box-containing protein
VTEQRSGSDASTEGESHTDASAAGEPSNSAARGGATTGDGGDIGPGRLDTSDLTRDIDVLLVDDSREWAEYVGRGIDQSEPDISVTVATSANEALLALEHDDGDTGGAAAVRTDEPFDCVVADYRMPEITGLELLDRMRAEGSEVPFVLVTGQGSEAVAEKAIQSQVDDYVAKDPGTDQVAQLVRRIRSVVERHRLTISLREKEAHYREVIERSRDAIVALRPERVLLANERATTLTGRSRETLATADFLTEVIHPDDRDQLRRVLADAVAGRHHELPTAFDCRVQRADGDVRHCEFGCGAITFDGEPALLCSIHDVTPRWETERRIERERDMNRRIQRALVETRTRGELEREVCETLVSVGGYETAWVAGRSSDGVTRRAVAGETGYLDTVSISTDSGGRHHNPGGSGGHHDTSERAGHNSTSDDSDGVSTGSASHDGVSTGSASHDGVTETDREPTLWAVASREPQFVSDLCEMFPTAWQTAAEAAGYQSVAAVPVVHEEVLYGVVTVYHADADRFDEAERRLLSDLADTMAFALAMRERGEALLADTVTRLGVQLVEETHYLAEAVDTDGDDDTTLTVQATEQADDDQFRQVVDVSTSDAASVRERLSAVAGVTEATTVSADETGARLGVTLDRTPPEAVLGRLGGHVAETAVSGDGVSLTVELPRSRDVSAFVDEAEDSLGSVTVTSVTDHDRSDEGRTTTDHDDPTGELTDKQREVLRTAFYHGYFDQPREQSSDEVADALGIARSTFLQHLRTAQRKVFAAVVDGERNG